MLPINIGTAVVEQVTFLGSRFRIRLRNRFGVIVADMARSGWRPAQGDTVRIGCESSTAAVVVGGE
jgi:hypothetical protein